ncbi:hypothetical protein Tco_0856848 [Tanacetum coccineum]|uniref:Uncharacterized protein n=1 Tax=Tanacetum coccineum TaxID=301880 RepID=A0ABQ5B5A6_9ASTR
MMTICSPSMLVDTMTVLYNILIGYTESMLLTLLGEAFVQEGSEFLMGRDSYEFLEQVIKFTTGFDGIFDSERDYCYLEELFKYPPGGESKLPSILEYGIFGG